MRNDHRELLLSLPPQVCDKCGGAIALRNNAGVLALLAQRDIEKIAPLAGSSERDLIEQLRQGISRHLNPVCEDGEQICEGSPSRASSEGFFSPELASARSELLRFANRLEAHSAS